MSTFIFINTIGGGISIPAVANYDALIAAYPPPNTAYLGQYVFCENAQGTWWIPGPVLGTYYPAGVYYCNGVDWKYTNVPYQATQSEVDAGTITDKFVSPDTFNNASKWSNYAPVASGLPIGGTSGQILAKIDAIDYNAEWIDNYANWTSQVKEYVKSAQIITKGQAVYVSSADGTNIIISKASNATEATSSKTLGLLAQDLGINDKGYVITEGLLSNIDTSAASAAGDPVWLGTNGNLIFGLVNKPYAPAHLVYIGVVTKKNPSTGEIYINVQNGFELKEIHDVDLITVPPVNNNVLSYNSTSSLWEPKSIITALGYTPYNSTNPNGYTSNTGTVTSVSGTSPINVATGTTTPAITITQATTSANGYLSSTDWNTFNNKLSATVTSPTGGDVLQYNATTTQWVNSPAYWTIDLMDLSSVEFYTSQSNVKINSITNIVGSPTITIADDGVAYTLGNTITIGSKITVTSNIASVVKLNITY